ncbi:unnamed protein product [Symbiodinium natans]|uniref:Uncharacterized protein n=1 Tax=Symbiodinium natans TaxID=878477 RepID=A0A812QCA7_9DINO|nr:unnamed protein product [Symbiodinium natans]
MSIRKLPCLCIGLSAIAGLWACHAVWLTSDTWPLALLGLWGLAALALLRVKEWLSSCRKAMLSVFAVVKVIGKWLACLFILLGVAVACVHSIKDLHSSMVWDVMATSVPKWTELKYDDEAVAAFFSNASNLKDWLTSLDLDDDGKLGMAKVAEAVLQTAFLACAAGAAVKCCRRWFGKHGQVTAYDAVLAFDSLAHFLATGEIKYLQFAESQFDALHEDRFRIVAVVGLFDKGKTWLTNKLFRKNLPNGKLCTTKGLSFLWVPERRMLVLDSAGVQGTVSYKSQAVDSILDARTTESLMFDMISRISHHMIFVVNDFTWLEQEYEAMLLRKYLSAHQNKELIVVHNLRMTSRVHEAQELFERQITQCYEGGSSHMGKLLFTAELGDAHLPVHHIGLCQEYTQAGRKFNNTNCDYLMQQLEHRHTLGSKVILTKLLETEFTRLIPKFVLVETAPEVDKAVQELKVEYSDSESQLATRKPEPGEGEYLVRGVMKLVLPRRDAQVTMKKQGVISPLGEIIAHDVSFEPNVNVFDQRVEDGTERHITIECPGVSEEDIEWEELSNGVKVTIQKSKAIDEAVVQPVQPIMQNHGTWFKNFVFDHGDGRFELRGGEDCILEQGVLTIKLHKSSQSRRGKVGRHVADPLPTLLTATAASSISGFEVIPAADKEAAEAGAEI